MQPWIIVATISLAFSVPVLIASYYTFVLALAALLAYPKKFGATSDPLVDSPTANPLVSILVSVYNERFVIERTLGLLAKLDYPSDKLEVIVADDSTDETKMIVNEQAERLRSAGISAKISRRTTRGGYKSGALNHAARLIRGDYVLLLDSDSVPPSNILKVGLIALKEKSDCAFAAYRIAHYNRDRNLTTRLFALSQDTYDTYARMGSTAVGAPFPLWAGCALISHEALKQVHYWTKSALTDDVDVSCKFYSAGKKGVYLSEVKAMSEDPLDLETWKRQAARICQGLGQSFRSNIGAIAGSRLLTFKDKLALFVLLFGPFSNVSWLIATFLSAVALLFGLGAPENSIFSSPLYILFVSVPVVGYFVASAYSLRIHGILAPRNLILLPLLSYSTYCMLTACSIGFVNGLRGSQGVFFRTPKLGESDHGSETQTKGEKASNPAGFDRTATLEAALASVAIALSLFVAAKEVWVLCLSLAGFGLLTLKSLNISRHL